MDVRIEADFSEVDKFFEDGEWNVESAMIDAGKNAIEFAESNGNYRDHTLTLRSSNKYDVDRTGLKLYNDAKALNGEYYATFVESKGFDVLSSAALHAERELKDMFEK